MSRGEGEEERKGGKRKRKEGRIEREERKDGMMIMMG